MSCKFCSQNTNENLPINTNNSLRKTFAFITCGENKELVLSIDESGFIETYGIPVEFCPKCGRKLMKG